jgi:hypothetical protein
MEAELRQKRVTNPKQVLESSRTALVVVTGNIPAGARKGELFDVEVSLPQGSKVTSLKGGYLQLCLLRNYDTKKNLDPTFKGPDRWLAGHVVAHAEGPLIVGLDTDGDCLTHGSLWQGGVSHTDRPYFLMLKEDRRPAQVANAVVTRINATYQDDLRRQQQVERLRRLMVMGEITSQINEKFKKTLMAGTDMAKAASPQLVYVNVPWEYRLNSQRYLRVVMLVPLAEPPEGRQPYRQRLKAMLHEPANAIVAALRLEALGKESIGALKTGLEDRHPLVRFCAAESLAYLGNGAGVDELGKLADAQPQLRAYCLTALASLDEPVCRSKLMELLSSVNAETRYGAFRALQLLGDTSPPIKGDLLNNTLWLHRVAAESPPLVHYSLQRRAEIVLFGRDAQLTPPFRLLAGKEFTVIATADDDRCTISRFQVKAGRVLRKQCSLKMEDVLRTLSEIGAEYPDVIALLHQLEEQRSLSCAIALNQVPQPISVEDLAAAARDPNFLQSAGETIPPGDREHATAARTETAGSSRPVHQGTMTSTR